MSADDGTAATTVDPDAPRPRVSDRDADATGPLLESWLAERLPAGADPKVSDVSSPEKNGMSSETLLFDVTWTEGGVEQRRSCVARIEPPASAVPVFESYDLDKQYAAMQLVGERTAVPVPECLWFEPDPSVLGMPFFVMGRVDGVVPPDVMPYTFGDCWLSDASPEEQARVQQGAIETLVGIHSLTPENADLTAYEYDRPEPTALGRHLAQWKHYYDWVAGNRRTALLDGCFAWLDEHFPADESPAALSWGDSRIGNMLWHDFAPSAVLDWEMVGVAPPEVDLGWMLYLHQFFQDLTETMGLPGMPDFFRIDESVAAYEQAAGHPVGDIRWFVAYAAMRHGVIMRRVTERSIAFGEVPAPDDPDDTIIHRSTLEGMLDGSYWSKLALP